MTKIKLLSTLLFAGAFALNVHNGALAACSPTASQTVTGTLAQCKCVQTDGGNISANIDCDGVLSAAFVPAFQIKTNSASATNMYLEAKCNTLGGVLVNALSGTGATGGTFISLTNQTGASGIPTAAAVLDAQAPVPVPVTNTNVIAFGVNAPTTQAGILVYTWNAGTKRWDAVLTKKGTTNTALTVPAAAARPLTFSFDDEPGSYQAIVTLSFV